MDVVICIRKEGREDEQKGGKERRKGGQKKCSEVQILSDISLI